MGRLLLRGNYNKQRQDQHNSYFAGIQKGRVSAVHLSKGTVEVAFDGMLYSREVVIPLLGLSCPIKTEATADTYMLGTSWGRYIPQVGDMLLIGFDSNGEPYALGYHAIFYEGFKNMDDAREAKGGIGWGDSSGKRLQPGDWDFKSARSCSLYLGDNAKIASGPHSIALNKSTGDLTSTSGLVQDKYGEAGVCRKGDARRFLLPTDAAETYIYSIIPGNNTKTAQESNDVVRYGSLSGIPVELSRIQHGEVIDETTMTPMVPAINLSLKTLTLLAGTGVRMLQSVKDPSGTTDFYISAVDDLGNYGVSAISAVGFQWMTPAATWQINNLVTTYTSTTSYTLTSPAITLSGATSITLTGGSLTFTGSSSISMTAPTISALGTVTLGATGGAPLVKETPAFVAAWSAYFAAAATAWAALAAIPALGPAAASLTAAGTAAGSMAAALSPAATTTTTAM